MAAVLRGRAELADVRSFIGELYGPDLHANGSRHWLARRSASCRQPHWRWR